MKKRTLRFKTLEGLAAYARKVNVRGYFINTSTLTITGDLTRKQIELALEKYDAHLMLTTKKIFSYEYS